MRKVIVFFVILTGCFISSSSFAELVLEVTDCRDNVVQIEPESSGIGTSLGEGWVKYPWEKIEKAIFTCDDKQNKDWRYPAKIISKDSGTKEDIIVEYFYRKEKNEQGSYQDCYLRGKKDVGIFVLYASKIKQIVVKKK